MLSEQLRTQIKEMFSKLDNTVEIKLEKSKHDKFNELKTFLYDVTDTSDKVHVTEIDSDHDELLFSIQNVFFKGIPTGHEFSSLLLAILNSDNKGKFPDENIQKRIKSINEGEISTVISLTCENCPDVIQNLNLISFINPKIKSTMIDGQYYSDYVEKLNIQSVPSIVCRDHVIGVGRQNLIEIIELLEETLGTSKLKKEVDQNKEINFDVVVVGGGPAGVSSAIYTARKGFKTAIIADQIGGQLNETKGIENMISIPYTEGKPLSANLREHLESYEIDILDNRKVKEISKNKILITNNQELIKAKSIVVATGAKWKKLNIKGEQEYLGSGVGFCPHCDGPFMKGKDIAVIGGGNSGIEAAIDLANIVNSIKILEFSPESKADKVLLDKLKTLSNVELITNAETKEIKGSNGKVSSLIYQDRATNKNKELDVAGIFIQIGLIPNSEFLKDLLDLNDYGEIIVDAKGKTNIKGIYGAGDVTNTPYKQIVVSIGDGAKAGLTASEELMMS